MNKNPLQFTDNLVLVDGLGNTTCLKHIGCGECNEHWHATDTGGACLVTPGTLPGKYSLASAKGKAVHLLSPKEVADYVRTEATKFAGRNWLDASLEGILDLTNLAIYPGYFNSSEPEEPRCLVLDAFRSGLAQECDDSVDRVVARYIFSAVWEHGWSRLVGHALAWMPKTYVGMLVAHGLVQGQAWGKRHAEALLEGWRYQLKHPEGTYFEPSVDAQSGYHPCLIQRLRQEDRDRLLMETGISESDYRISIGLADAVGGGNLVDEARAMLVYLTANSNVRRPTAIDIGGGLPADVGY